MASLPMLTGTLYGGASVAGSLPMLTVSLIGSMPRPSALTVDLPAITGSMRTGASLSGEITMLTASMSGTVTLLATVDVQLPALQARLSGTVTRLATLRATIPMLEASMRAGGKLAGELPMLAAALVGKVGGVGRIAVELPGMQAELEGTINAFGQLEVTLPALRASDTGRMAVVLPMLQAALAGGPEVVVTYEAYAVNLKPGEKMPHQVTRYTGFPFNQIVRYQGRYIGVADDGLYELGGDTDYDATTPAGPPWSWYTGITDFGSSQKKAVRETMIGARLGPSVTASVSIGEAADKTYAATIVRGQSAQNHRIKFGRGLSSRYWSFGLADADGGACDIDTMQFDATELGRKL